jgi:hypothetical protein
MRILLSYLLVAIVLYSCKKVEVQASEILISHKWSPYQTRIITFDTTTLTTYDSSGRRHSISSTFHKDTTYSLDPCVRQSTYSFQSNGISKITNMCTAGQSVTDTPWSIQPNRLLQVVFIDDPVAENYYAKLYPDPLATPPPPSAAFYPVQNGFITQLNGSQLVVDQPSSETYDLGNYRVGIRGDSLVRIVSDMFITFRSQ